MKMYPFFSGLIVFSLLSEAAFALPEKIEVVSGKATISIADPRVMKIEVSDKAIVNYDKFSIEKGTKVQFIQPSKDATVLNRVTSRHPSKILGSLESNGKVFLVNPNGIYFGPKSQVNVGSLIASTLHIKDQDFLEGNCQFILDQDNHSLILNEGFIHAEQSIALVSSHIQNLGMIEAKTGSVVLAAGEVVTLDFTGDGLLSFAVEGPIEETIIENKGTIKALEGSLVLKLATAKKVIAEIVNHEGLEEGAVFIEKGGKIFLVPESELLAKQVVVEGGSLSVQGEIKSEKVQLLGCDIDLIHSKIDVSMPLSGGEVFIGGEFQGKGTTPYASKVWMDSTSSILANALEEGPGGLVVLWSKQETVFNGRIEAKGGILGGVGGVVETSSLGNLGIETGSVLTKSSMGTLGNWLLDPDIIYVGSSLNINDSGGACNACKDCSLTGDDYTGDPCNPSFTYTIKPSCLDNGGNVILRATTAIQVNDSITVSEGSLLFEGCTSDIPVYLNGNLFTTGNHSITFTKANPHIYASEGQSQIIVDTTFSGAYDGADIVMEGVYATTVSGNPAATLLIKAGTGNVTLSTLSGKTANAIEVDSAALITIGELSTNGTITFPSSTPVELSASSVTINSNSHNIKMQGTLNSSSSNTRNLTMNAGTGGTVQLGTVGNENTINNLSITGKSLSATLLKTQGTVTIDTVNSLTSVPTIKASGALTIKPNISLGATTSYSTTNSLSTGANIILLGTVDGNQSLTLDAGSGGNISGGTNGTDPLKTIGGTTPLTELIITKANNVSTGAITAGFIKQTSGSSTSTFGGLLTATGSSGISLAANALSIQSVSATNGGMTLSSSALTISSGSTINLHGALSQVGTGGGNTAQIGASSITTNNGSISFQMPISLVANQTWNAGTGSISTTSITGTTSFTISGASSFLATGDVSFGTFNETVSGSSSFGGALTTISGISLTGDTFTFNGPITSSNGGLSVHNSGTASIGSDITTKGAISFDASSAVTLIGNGTWNSSSSGGSITAGTINGAFNLTLNPGSGEVNVSQVGETTPLKQFVVQGTVALQGATTFAASSILLEGEVTASSPFAFTLEGGSVSFLNSFGSSVEGLGAVTITGSSAAIGSIYTEGAGISIVPATSLNTSATLTTTAGSVSTGANITFSSTLDGTSSGGQSLTVDAGTNGIFSVGTIGGVVPLGFVDISSAPNFNMPSISTNNGQIDIHPTINLLGDRTLSSAISSFSDGADIDLFSTIDGSNSLVIDSGVLGSVTVYGNVGGTTALSSLQINSGSSVDTQEIHTSGSLGIQISSGDSSIIAGAVTTTGGGGVLLDNTGTLELDGDMTLTGPFSQIGEGNVMTQSSILQSTAITFTGSIELLNSITLSSVFGNGIIELHRVTSPGIPYSLGIDAGTGDVDLLGNLGNSTEGLDSVMVTGHTISMQSIYTEGGAISITPTTSLIVLSGNTVLESTVDTPSGAPIALNADVDASVAGGDSLTVDSGSSVFTVGTIGGNSPLGSIEITAASDFVLPNITTENGSIQIHPSTVLASDVAISSNGADITFFSTIDASTFEVETLTLNAGSTGTIDLQGEVGGITALGGFVIVNANDVDLFAIASKGLVQTNGTGTTLFQDTLNIGIDGIHLTGTAFHFEESVTTVGGISIDNTGPLRIERTADMTLAGNFIQQGTGRVFTAGDIQTSGDISFQSSIELTGNVFWDTQTLFGGTITSNGRIDSLGVHDLTIHAGDAVSFFGPIGTPTTGIGALTVTGSSASIQSIYTRRSSIMIAPAISLNADTVISTIASNHPLGASITLGSTVNGFFDLTVHPGIHGTLSMGTVGGVVPLHTILITGEQIFAFPDMTTSGGSIAITSPLEIVDNRTLKTTASSLGANISLFSTVNSIPFFNKDLTLESGIGTISLLESVGLEDRIGIFTIVSVKNAQINDLFATTLLQNFGSGISTFAGVINTLGGGVNLTGNAFVFKGTITVNDSSGFYIENEGPVVFASIADLTCGGPFVQSGIGLVKTGADIMMNGSAASITFEGPVSLIDEVNWNTVSGNGSIVLDKALEGPGELIIHSGIGNVLFNGLIGTVQRVGSLDITALSTHLKKDQVRTSRSQLYHSNLDIETSTTFSNQSGNIEIEGTFNATKPNQAATFSMGSGALIFSSAVGSLEELLFLTAYNTGSFSAETIKAGYLRVSGGIPTIQLNGDVHLSKPAGLFLDGGPIFLGDTVEANQFFIRSRGNTENITTPHAISSPGSPALGFNVIDAIGGVVGSINSPIKINTNKSLLLGANPRADLAGTLNPILLDYISSNIPCIVTLNGVIIKDCNAIPKPEVAFDSIPKYFFYLPGIYSSWDNLSNDEYFLEEASYPADSPRNRSLFWKQSAQKKNRPFR